jgi:DNA-binding transcriptional LysR family regulator
MEQAMRARQLEVFTAVMRAGTITGAARLLNISQPALSQILIHAEDEIGFQLFDRDKGRLSPTPEALELYPEAERVFAGLEGLRRKTSDLRLGRAGLVRIAASPPPAISLLPRALAAYRARHPDILLRTHVAPIAAMIDMLRAGDAAMALALDDALPPDIHVERIGETSFCCLLPEAHPLSAATALSFADLENETVISYRTQTRPHDELEAAARRVGARFVPRIEIDASLSAAGFVQVGLGVAVVDALLPWTFFPGITPRPLTDAPSLPLSLLTVREKPLSRAEDAMREQIRATPLKRP